MNKDRSEQNTSTNSERSVLPEVEIAKVKKGFWQTYDATDGLPGGVWCLLQDRKGFLWLGTEVGICRYDGTEFITYTTADGLAHNYVYGCCPLTLRINQMDFKM